MLFVLTNSQDATASFLCDILEKRRVAFVRLDTGSLLSSVEFEYRNGVPWLVIDHCLYQPREVDTVWYRRPEELKHPSFDDLPESKYAQLEWSEFIENFFAHIPRKSWINHPSDNAGASRKLEQLTTATKYGILTPDTLVTQKPNELKSFFARHSGRIIAKPVSTGYLERPEAQNDSLIYTTALRREDLDNLDDLPACPTLFQESIQKSYDVRITVLDSTLHAVALEAKEGDGTQRCDIRRNNMADVVYRQIEVPSTVRRGILALISHYHLRFAAIDFGVTSTGDWYFFEINPNGQWAWLDMAAGTNIAESFIRAFGQSQ